MNFNGHYARFATEATKGQVMAESVMIALAGKGMGRQEAHRLLREAAMTVRKKDVHLKEVLAADPVVTTLRSAKDLQDAMDPDRYVGRSGDIVDAIAVRGRNLFHDWPEMR